MRNDMDGKTSVMDHDGTDKNRRLALRPKEVAKALGIGERLLWSMTNQGLIPHLKWGKAILYPIGELERFMAEQAAKAVHK